VEEKKDVSVENEVSGGSENNIKGVTVLVFVLVAIVIIGSFVYFNKSKSSKKVESVTDITSKTEESFQAMNQSEGQKSFEEIHKFSAEDLENISLGGEEDEFGKHFNAGIRFALRKDYDKAIEEYNKALAINPDVSELHNNLGYAFLDKGDIEQAIKAQKKALDIDPNLANAYYGLALALEKKGDTAGAIKQWEKYLEIAPSDSIWWNKAKERLDMVKSKAVVKGE
jgi:tetratricopeptide (TPR) repeat protein